ncbi:MAG: ATP-dependent Clp protease adaptor ClpS [Kiritimatiellae bacterium]|nr:ATP-dependent Clp protease adaptor ClpS [Kiritimatiellia bacterium]
MPNIETVQKPDQKNGRDGAVDGLAQVVLFNDDHNEAGYVVSCLMRTFGHSGPLAEKIMREAHTRGRAIAEVEGIEEARQHCASLQDAGLRASVESV